MLLDANQRQNLSHFCHELFPPSNRSFVLAAAAAAAVAAISTPSIHLLRSFAPIHCRRTSFAFRFHAEFQIYSSRSFFHH
jgi:hypothetical protein